MTIVDSICVPNSLPLPISMLIVICLVVCPNKNGYFFPYSFSLGLFMGLWATVIKEPDLTKGLQLFLPY